MPVRATDLTVWPPYEHSSDYLLNMSALTSKEARRIWRSSIKEAWSNRCAYCGQPPIDDNSLTIDHVKPRCRGGEDRRSNVIPACVSCNLDKGSSQDWLKWYRDQQFYNIENELRIKSWLASGVVTPPMKPLEMDDYFTASDMSSAA